MKTIGTITFHESINYGGILQAYALQKTLEGMGYVPEIIDYCNPDRGTAALSGFRRVLHRVWHGVVVKILVGTDRRKNTDEFRRKYLRLSPRKYCDEKSLHADPPVYDAYITGSDQVWNPRNNNGDASYFLTFAPEGKKRISYAASFGVAEIPGGVGTVYAQWLKQIHRLSVREIEGARLVNELTKTEAEMVLDPTLLLDRDQWRRVAVPCAHPRPYILCYYMPGDRLVNKSITALARQVADRTGWRVISIGEKEYMRLNPFRCSIFNAGPAEFVGLFQNASFVITNSFHGAAFSINYRIPFVVPINRALSPYKALSSRITTLLQTLNLEERLVPAGECFSREVAIDLDYRPVESILEQWRGRSLDFLRDALESP